jgi:midasin
MNPATDVGKKQLALSIRSRFTEFFVDELRSQADFQVLVRSYLKTSFPSPQLVDGIIR